MAAVISVLLPYRNAADTLEEALDSLLSQSLATDIEVIAIDDGSTDRGPAAVAAIAARHGAVRALTTGGRGLVAALRLGLAAARGELIARMDADDISLPERFARQLDLMDSQSLAVVGTQVEAFPRERVAGGMRRYVAWQNSLVTAADHARELFVESPLCHPSVVLRRTIFDAIEPWRSGPFPEDYDLWLRCDAAGFALGKVPEVLFRWRHGDGRATFRDPRYAKERFVETKAPHLARRVLAIGRPVLIWGAGRTGKRLARAMEPHGLRPVGFVDIDERKIGRLARGVPVVGSSALQRGAHTVIVAVSKLGARDLIRQWLADRAFVEGIDYLCAA